MTITMWNTNKRINSTLRPSGLSEDVEVVMKEPSDILHPSFQLASVYASEYNYLYWNGRYYFVDNITYLTSTVVIMDCSIDVLATYRNEIGSLEEYIIRSSKPEVYAVGKYYTDISVPSNQGVSTTQISVNPFSTNFGFYVVGVVSPNANDESPILVQRGAISYIAMSNAQLSGLINRLNNLEVINSDMNPLQFIASCVYIPINTQLSNVATFSATYALASFSFEYYSTVANVQPADKTLRWTDTLALPKHPSTILFSDREYLNYSPFAKYTLYAAMFGTIPIPPEMFSYFNENRNMTLSMAIELSTGEGVLKISNPDGALISIMRSRVGVPVQLTQITTGSVGGYINTAIQAASVPVQAISFNYAGAVSSLSNAVKSAWDNSMPTVSSSGSSGSFIDITLGFILKAEFLYQAPINVEDTGRIVNAIKTISEMEGYFVLCADADIDSITATRTEIEMIKQYLDRGFFFE